MLVVALGEATRAERQLQATITVLREGHDETSRLAAPGLGDVPGLAESARAAGLRVDLCITDLPDALPATVELTAYRIVRDSLTNVIRHADAHQVEVTVTSRPDAVTVAVTDDGVTAHHLPAAPSGFGLRRPRPQAGRSSPDGEIGELGHHANDAAVAGKHSTTA